jgi:hypothetical protein
MVVSYRLRVELKKIGATTFSRTTLGLTTEMQCTAS